MHPITLRPARPDEAKALRDLERAASLAAHAHVFDPVADPYPHEAVLARWHDVLGDDHVTVLVAEDVDGLTALVAHDATTIRHLAVRPDRWRTGMATAALGQVVATSTARRLWCLEANARGLALYAARGWVRTGRTRPTAWPPHPVEVELVLDE